MWVRFALFALMAVGLAGFGSIAWIATHPPPPTAAAAAAAPAPAPLRTVLAAAHDLQAGALVKPEDVAARPIAAAAAPAGARPDTAAARAELIGAMIRRSLAAGEPLLAADVLRPGDHGFLAAVLGAGMRATTVGVDAVTGTAGLIWPGDRVDLILTQAQDDAALAPGHRVSAETVLADVRVIAIDQQLMQGAKPGLTDPQPARTVTLEVTPEQAERVAVATRLGRLSLAVRSAAGERPAPGAAGPDAAPPAGSTTWASDVSAALRGGADGPTGTLRVFSGGDSKEYHF